MALQSLDACSYTTFEVQKNDGQLLAVEMGQVGQLMPKDIWMCSRSFEGRFVTL